MARFLPTFALACALALTGATGAIAKEIEAKGYLYDKLCLNAPNGVAIDGTKVKTEADKHSVMCLLIPACVKSGFVLLKKTNGTFSPSYNLSASSTDKIVAFLKSLSRKANVYVRVTGTLDKSGALVIKTISDGLPVVATVTGYLYDNLCLNMPNGVAIDGTKVKTEADKHSVACLLIPACIKSGFSVLKKNADGTFAPTHKLSASSNVKIVAFLKSLTREANVLVKITGTPDASGAIVVQAISDAVGQQGRLRRLA